MHRLHGRSPYFDGAFQKNRFSDSGGVASFPDADPECLRQHVQAIYFHQVGSSTWPCLCSPVASAAAIAP